MNHSIIQFIFDSRKIKKQETTKKMHVCRMGFKGRVALRGEEPSHMVIGLQQTLCSCTASEYSKYSNHVSSCWMINC